MRKKNALRACALALVVAVLTTATATAFGATQFSTGLVHTFNSAFDPEYAWEEVIPGSSAGGIALTSPGPTTLAKIFADGGSDVWELSTEARAESDEKHLAAYASATISFNITDQITAEVECFSCNYFTAGDDVLFTPEFSVEGMVGGSAIGSGTEFIANVTYHLYVANQLVASGLESVDSSNGYTSTIPRGLVPVSSVFGQAGVPAELRIELGSWSYVSTLEEPDTGDAFADFGHTFRWVGVTDVFNGTTGQPIPTEFFHLYSEDGFDWAHPSAVPEPSTIGVLTPLTLFLARRRRISRG